MVTNETDAPHGANLLQDMRLHPNLT